MSNRWTAWMFRLSLLSMMVISLSACGYFGGNDAEQAAEEAGAAVEAEEAAEEMEMAACPHGGGACCESGEPHQCCPHTMN